MLQRLILIAGIILLFFAFLLHRGNELLNIMNLSNRENISNSIDMAYLLSESDQNLEEAIFEYQENTDADKIDVYAQNGLKLFEAPEKKILNGLGEAHVIFYNNYGLNENKFFNRLKFSLRELLGIMENKKFSKHLLACTIRLDRFLINNEFYKDGSLVIYLDITDDWRMWKNATVFSFILILLALVVVIAILVFYSALFNEKSSSANRLVNEITINLNRIEKRYSSLVDLLMVFSDQILKSLEYSKNFSERALENNYFNSLPKEHIEFLEKTNKTSSYLGYISDHLKIFASIESREKKIKHTNSYIAFLQNHFANIQNLGLEDLKIADKVSILEKLRNEIDSLPEEHKAKYSLKLPAEKKIKTNAKLFEYVIQVIISYIPTIANNFFSSAVTMETGNNESVVISINHVVQEDEDSQEYIRIIIDSISKLAQFVEIDLKYKISESAIIIKLGLAS